MQKWQIDNRIWLAGGLVAVLILTAIAAGYGVGRVRGRTQPADPTVAAVAAQPVGEALAQTPTAPPVTPATATQAAPPPTPTPAPITDLGTPTPAPASALSAAQMAQAYAESAVLALNDIPGLDFTSTRAASLLRRLAQEQGLIFVPVSFAELSGDTWAVLAAPRTSAGEPLPVLLWRDTRDLSRIHGQVLGDNLDAAAWGAGRDQGRVVDDGLGYSVLLVARSG
ncbi:MAG: hypothetical protein KAZ38_21825, partial [Caldilineaceae bacterium]|nr:hypothetical protein [Caldilineaceae bacterium]